MRAMRTLAWRNWVLTATTVTAACTTSVFGVGCGGDDSTAINDQDGGGDVIAPPNDSGGGTDSTTGNDTGTDIDGGTDTGAAIDSGQDTGTAIDTGIDTGIDAGIDTGIDSGIDAGTDGAIAEAGGDASDAALACSPANSACTGGGVTSGLCKSATCTACTDPTDDTLCTTAYATDGGVASFICNAGSCIAGNCHTSATCAGEICATHTCARCTTDTQCKSDSTYGANFVCNTTTGTCVTSTCNNPGNTCTVNAADECCTAGLTSVCIAGNCCSNAQCAAQSPACQGNTCATCDAVANNTYYVDPVNGSDTLGDGSGKAGGTAASVCAYKTITKALAMIGVAPAANTKIFVVGPSTVQAGETFPISVPVNVTISGMTGAVVVSMPVTATNGFLLHAGSSGLANLIIDGTGNTSTAHGIVAQTGSQASTTVTGVEVRNFATEAGIRVGDTAVLTIGAGTNVHNCGSASANRPGLHVTGTGSAIISSTTDTISFHNNSFAGIGVDGAGSVQITGTPGSGAAGTVTTYSNIGPGIIVAGVPVGGIYPTLSNVTGLVSYLNTGDGARFVGGTNVKLRGSRFYSNLIGITVNQAGSGALSYNDDVSHIDLGTNPSSDPGNNVFQSPALVDGGVTLTNSNAGLCFTISANKSQTLLTAGNKWANATSTAVLDCALVNPGTLSKASTCAGGVDLGGNGQQGNTVAIANCN
jgi:hypothetical protein